MKRRQLLLALTAAPLVITMTGRIGVAGPADAADDRSLEEIRRNWKSLLAPDTDVALSTEPIQKSEDEWKQVLSDVQFQVLREEGTEPAFSSLLNDEKRAGVYVCAGCTLPLFTSQMKYDSEPVGPASLPTFLNMWIPKRILS